MRIAGVIKILPFLFCTVAAFAQKGTLRGTVIDETGQPLYSANAVLKGTTIGTTTDFDGKFELKADPGTYSLVVSFIGYNSLTITDVEVKTGEVNVIEVIKIQPSSSELGEVTVTASSIRNTEAAMLTVKKKSVNVLDGISAQTFQKIGDGDAAAAVTRVPGVSLQGGKYVYVRGLGDRYTKTTLNGMDVPGLDPDRNAIQMDIFPTNIIENITVLKSFTADLPADMAGGIVNIETKDFPDKPSFNVSASVGYNPEQHFNSNYKTYPGGGTDFLGFDDGTRAVPSDNLTDPNYQIPNPALQSSETTEVTKSFNSTLAVEEATSPANFSLGASGGNQYDMGDSKLGLIGSVSYKNTTNYYDQYQQNYYFKNPDPSIGELRTDRAITGALGENNVYLNGLLGLAIKNGTTKHRLNLMHLQNGQKLSGYFRDDQMINNSALIYRDNLEYNERSLSNVLLAGEYLLANTESRNNWELSWRVSPTLSRLGDKDVRVTPYVSKDGEMIIDPSEGASPVRIWRYLNEVNVPAKVDAAFNHELLSYEAKLKMGVGYTYKYRDFEILNYQLVEQPAPNGEQGVVYTGDANELLTDEFIWTPQKRYGMFYAGNYQPSNTFNARQTIISAYASEEFQFSSRFKSVVGLRVEKFDHYYTGQDQAGVVFNDENVLDLLDLFPTISLIYFANEKTNLRFSYFRTTARPSFKEKSTAQIQDVLKGQTELGNLDLTQTYIDNLDVRYEIFYEKNQTVAVSAFYKYFTDPIERVTYSAAATSNFQPRNVGDGQVYGLEFELRKNFDFISPSLENLSLNTNLTYAFSQIALDKTPGGQYESRVEWAREGETVDEFRPMQGQAPYIVNAGLSYNDPDLFEAGIYYNVQGRRLAIVGIARVPDVYTEPFHSLNFNLLKSFGEDKKFQVGLSVDNILDDLKEETVESYGSDDRIFNSYNPGRVIGLSFSYKIR